MMAAMVVMTLVMVGLVWICGVATGAVGMGLWLLHILNKTTEDYIKKAQKDIEDLMGGEEWKKGKDDPQKPQKGLSDEDYRKLLGE